MASISIARKISILANIAARHAGQTRTFGAVKNAAQATASHLSGVAHQLWLEVTGFAFIVISVIGASAWVREYHKYQAGQTTPGRVVLASVFTLAFAWFGVSSFWRVRKKQR
jgi:hypothetical protein